MIVKKQNFNDIQIKETVTLIADKLGTLSFNDIKGINLQSINNLYDIKHHALRIANNANRLLRLQRGFYYD